MKSGGSQQGGAIEVEREVLVPGVQGTPWGMAQLSNGGFVIVGALVAGWAVSTDANGAVLWKYEEPYDPAMKTKHQSEFHSVTVLPNGQILLCGQSDTDEHRAGLIVTLDEHGHFIERRILFPNNQRTDYGSFDRIVPWGDGYALTGWGTDRVKSYFWLVKLDINGVEVWDKVRDDIVGMQAVALKDDSLLQVGGPSGDVAIARLDSSGHSIARRSIEMFEAKPVHPYRKAASINVLAVDGSWRNVLISLKDNLQDEGSRKIIGPPRIHDGCAFELPDGSVALFGNQLISGGESRSAIGRWGPPDGLQQMSVPKPDVSSYSFRDAIRIAPTQFVAMRDQVGGVSSSSATGVVLSWISFN